MITLYRLALWMGAAVANLLALGGGKMRLWVQGRRDWRAQLAGKWVAGGPTVWIHCASLGEFEQGRTLLEEIRRQHPDTRIVLTFFSPSGYEARKNYPHADLVCYLPLDGPANAQDFLNAIRPTLAVFVKYELWYYYLAELDRRKIPVALVSAHIRPNGGFASFPARIWYRRLFQHLSLVAVQEKASLQILRNTLNFKGFAVAAGDTRFDRVGEIADNWVPIPEVESFIGGRHCFVAGSTWPPDERLVLQAVSRTLGKDACLILVPHDLNEHHLDTLAADPRVLRYSQLALRRPEHCILLVDTIGMLSRIYRYADLVWIGGGFGAGIHNTLEAAAYGKRICFGPHYEDFLEARGLIEAGAARMIDQAEDLAEEWRRARADEPGFNTQALIAGRFVADNRGATRSVLLALQTHGLWPAIR